MRIPMVQRLAAVAVLMASLLVGVHVDADVSDGLDGRAAATSPANRLRPVDRALLVSDSAWLGMHLFGGVDSVQGFEHTLALASCRRRVATSCTNFDGFVPITLVDELDDHPQGYSTLIVATGYNDGDGRLRSEIDEIVRLARSYGYRRVVWLTLRSNVTYTSPDDAGFAAVFERSNALLSEVAHDGAYPELIVADWATYARDRPEWFSRDGIHLRTRGGFAAGDYISRKMAFLDGRECPQPTIAGGPVADPCPDPDAQLPVVDLDSLYPLGAIERPPFTLRWEGSSSWPDPPYWER